MADTAQAARRGRARIGQWIDRFGDRDGDLFVEYSRRSPTGLVQQGWKDSQDSIFHADGSLAEAPIALCEVQAYVYGAKRQAGAIAEALGHTATQRPHIRVFDTVADAPPKDQNSA